jgi:hypothetical protein
MFVAQNPDLHDHVEWESGWNFGGLLDNSSAKQFFGVPEASLLNVGPGEDMYDLDQHFSAWCGCDTSLVSELKELQHPVPLLGSASGETLSKYIIPQMVYRYVYDPTSPLSWDFEHYYVWLS